MRVILNPEFLFSEDYHSGLSARDGSARFFNRQQRRRLSAVPRQGAPIQPIDLDLLKAGALSTQPAAEFRKGQIAEEVKNAWANTGYLTIMPTEKCNFRCTYCYETFAKGRMPDKIVDSIIRYLENTIPQVPHFFLAWFGGEPLLHPPIIRRVSSAYRDLQKKHGGHGSISITTNGHLLNDKVIGQLEPIDVDVYQISLDGPQEIHDSQRLTSTGRGTYQAILDNIENLLRKSGSNILLRMNIDASRPGKAALVKRWLQDEIFVRFAAFEERVNYHVVPIWEASTTSIDGICLKEVHKYQTWMDVKKLVLAHKGTTPKEHLAALISKTGKLACYAGQPNSFVIGSDGRVYKCTVAFDLPENQVGSIRPDGTLEIDRDREKRWTGENFLTDPICGGCAFSRSCQGISCGLTRILTQERPCPTVKRFHKLILETPDNRASAA